MKINTKTRYGLRVMIELALNKHKERIYQKDIAINQDISFKYLDPIIAGLKSSGLASTVSGKKSGYKLSKDPGEISVYDVYHAFNPRFAVVDCLIDKKVCRKTHHCSARNFWHGLNDQIISYLKSITIEDLAKSQTELDQHRQELIYEI